MPTQFELYLQEIEEEKKRQEEEESDFFYTPDVASSQKPEGYETFITDPNLEQSNIEPIRSGKKTLTQLKETPEFANKASRFLDGIGSNEDIFEYLRDSEYSLSSAIARSFQTGKWTEEQKQDYVYLRDEFNKAEIGNWKERFKMIADIGVDVVADPLNIVTALFAIPTGGQSLTARAALGTAAQQGVKQLTKSQLKTKALKESALFGAAEGMAWGGLHNYFVQDIDIDLGLQDDIDFTSIQASTLLGAGFGGILGGGTRALTYNKAIKEAGEKAAQKVDDSVDNVPVNEMPEGHQQLEFKFSNEDVINDVANAKTRQEVLEDSRVDDTLVEPLEPSKTDKTKDFLHRFIAGSVGKPTTAFLSHVDKSPLLKELLGKFRYDYDVTLTSKGEQVVKKDSYGLSVGTRTGKYLYGLAKSLNVLDRVGFRARLAKDQQDAMNVLLRDRNIVSTKAQAEREGKIWIRNLIDKEYKGITVTQDLAVSYGGTTTKTGIKFDGQSGLRNLLDNTYADLNGAGLFKSGTVNKGGFLPRLFNYKALSNKDNRAKFEELLVESGHANPLNDIDEITIRTSDNIQVKGIKEDAVGIDEEVFGVNFLKQAGGDEELAKQLKANRIVEDMLQQRWTPFEIKMMTKNKVVGDSSGYLQARRFTNIDDNKIAFVLENDTQTILEDYFSNAARAIERSNYFGKNIVEFDNNQIQPIIKELTGSGMSMTEAQAVADRLRNMHRRVTGIETDSQSVLKKNAWARGAADWGKLSQQMAHLPFATLSSITEPFLLLTRAGKSDAPRVLGDIATALVKEGSSIVDRSIKGFQRGVLRQRVKGIKDIDDEAWGELYQTGLALEQAVQERLEGLAGEGLHNTYAKNAQQAFFKVNLLTQWTKAVQLASFTTGKRLIRQNAEKLYKDSLKTKTIKTGIGKTTVTRGKTLSKSKKKYLTEQLGDLGINADEAVSWYKNSLKDGVFDNELARSQSFYHERYTTGANRFVKEIILNPSTAEANRPLWFSTPSAQLLVQFAGYPTVFNNTILKRFSTEAVNSPAQSIPKVVPTLLLMSGVAHVGNTIRSQGENLKDYETGMAKDDGEIIFEAVRRWGGLGPFDYAAKFDNEYDRNAGDLTSVLKTFAGPLPQDFIDGILYRKNIPEIIITNVPGYGLIPPDIRKEMRSAARGTTTKTKKYKAKQYARGGIVTNVPNVKDEPDEMINRQTGLPFNASSEAVQDLEDRELKSQMKGLGL